MLAQSCNKSPESCKLLSALFIASVVSEPYSVPNMWSHASSVTIAAVSLVLLLGNVFAGRYSDMNTRSLKRQEESLIKRQLYYANGTNSTQGYQFYSRDTRRMLIFPDSSTPD